MLEAKEHYITINIAEVNSLKPDSLSHNPISPNLSLLRLLIFNPLEKSGLNM